VGPVSTLERSAAVRDHLANERTLLAWQRTALALVGLGFVVDRFAFEGSTDKALLGTVVGLGMIVAGGLAAFAGVYRFVRVERQIDTDSYRPAVGVHLVFAGAIVLAALAMVLYLLFAKSA
jgi:putative membrane protein